MWGHGLKETRKPVEPIGLWQQHKRRAIWGGDKMGKGEPETLTGG